MKECGRRVRECMGQLNQCPLAYILLPTLASVLCIWVVAECYFRAPITPAQFVCFKVADDSHKASKDSHDGAGPSGPTTPSSNGSTGQAAGSQQAQTMADCEVALKNKLAKAWPGQPQASAEAGVSFAISLAFGLTLFWFAAKTIYTSRGGLWVCGSIGVAAVVGWGIWHAVPHQATLTLLSLLQADPEYAGGQDKAVLVAKFGSGFVAGLSVLYVIALSSIALPAGTTVKDRTNNLAASFDRLTTLSYFGAIAFVLAVVTLNQLLQWPLSLSPDFGPGLKNMATAVMTPFGAYLSTVLLASYLPTAAMLERQAACLARDALEEKRSKSRQNVTGQLRALKAANPDMAASIGSALSDAGFDLGPDGYDRSDEDLAVRLDWLQKRGLTVVSTTRLGASFAALLPLLAGSGGITGVISTLSH